MCVCSTAIRLFAFSDVFVYDKHICVYPVAVVNKAGVGAKTLAQEGGKE
jgi:hypothetical protein